MKKITVPKKAQSKPYYKCKIARNHCKIVILLKKDGKHYLPKPEPKKSSEADMIPQKPKDVIRLKASRLPKVDSPEMNRELFLAFCSFPTLSEDSKAAATLQLLVLLSQISDIAGEIPEPIQMPILELKTTATPPALLPLLEAIQGPQYWEGKDWELRRPWLIDIKKSIQESRPTTVLWDYIGGSFVNDYGKKRNFWFPYINNAMVLTPSLPDIIRQEIIQQSPYSLPIVYHLKKANSTRITTELAGDGLLAYKKEGLEKLANMKEGVYLQLSEFLRWFRKEECSEEWLVDINLFNAAQQKNNFHRVSTSKELMILSAAMSLFLQYLKYAAEYKEWLSIESAQEIRDRYWQWVIPETYPHKRDGKTPLQDNCDAFYCFLADYFTTYSQQIHKGNSGSAETMGLIHKLKEGDFLILPRKIIFKKYCLFLKAISPNCLLPEDDTKLQKCLMKAGVPLKHEANNEASWRFRFYKDTDKPLYCLGLQINSLPNNVKNELKSMFGLLKDETSNPSVPGTNPNDKERGKPHESNEF